MYFFSVFVHSKIENKTQRLLREVNSKHDELVDVSDIENAIVAD